MELILISLVGGIILGCLRPPGASQMRILQRIISAGLFILLAAMGAQLGANEKVLSNLDRMGLQALLLASLAVLGSVLAVYTVFRWLDSGSSGPVKEDSPK